MSAHTPGPWQVSKSKARRVTNAHGVAICNAILRNQGGPKHNACMKDEHEAEANAELIAAAPEMAGLLQTLRDYISDTASGTLSYEDSGDGLKAMAAADLARLDALLAKIGGAA